MKGRNIKIKKIKKKNREEEEAEEEEDNEEEGKIKNEEINSHSKQPSSCKPKHVTNFQMTNPSILPFFFVSSSPLDANSSFAFILFSFLLY